MDTVARSFPCFRYSLPPQPIAGENAIPAMQPAKPLEAYRYLDVVSWIITEGHVRTKRHTTPRSSARFK